MTHQKRLAIPKSWKVGKKGYKWVSTTRPGPHSKARSLPLGIIIRDILKLVDNSREGKRILSEGKVLVDGIPRKDLRFPVGLFDVISLPLINETYRVLQDEKGRLTLYKLSETNVNKLCRINNKTILKGGKVQLNLNDGANILGSNEYSTKDSLILSVPDKKIIKHLKFKVGNLAMVVGGQHSGEIGTIKEIKEVKSSRHNTVAISGETDFETIEDYVFVIGEDKPEIRLGGEAIE
ncbi:SSU ribosomal protein S4E [Methanosarcina thermophila]|uniref:Small ribosomal subunit protein eS4 n=2 Tax=Methanosarcina thermophila TaxID=2210 RepID=A0A1I6XRI1_METTE|nr:30S ribosomal protein S4e [Methanosarcina thermophila]AKB12911.1 SSU ribosomal protein S4e [Methanosarcina thermophila TM-1]SFT40304.1 SSU ribosomal protein S4E [Methanosarcina thermophila]HOQ65126.1 30S ribosomal protein S4e [Methanosarcina thermophila]HPT80418.1 30S ribosomal protein S4e [Methanosarcina thermophila]